MFYILYNKNAYVTHQPCYFVMLIRKFLPSISYVCICIPLKSSKATAINNKNSALCSIFNMENSL